MESVLSILLFIGAAQGLLLSGALFSLHRGNRTANRILAVLLFSFSFFIFSHATKHYHVQPPNAGNHRGFFHAFFFIFAPLMYFYSKALTQCNFKFSLKNSLHFIPFFAGFIAVLFFGYVFKQKDILLYSNRIFLVLITIQMVIYLICMLIILHRHKKNIQNTYSSLEKINLRWLKFFIISQTVIWPVAFFIDTHKHESYEMGYMWLLVSIFMYIIGYFGIRQPEIFSGELQEEQLSSQRGKKKYEKSALSPEQAETILQRLQALMQSSKPYLVPTLTLPSLSKQMNVSPHHLSQIINERLSQNYFEFINSFRVKEAKRLLKDPGNQHLTLAAIGFEAGFNSVSSFNSIFKKITSLTPSEYRLSKDQAQDNL
jgi:AraC-like DNA-binding protein